MFSRREFLQRTLQGSSLLALGAAGHLTVPGFLAKSALAAEPGKERILVVVELTGGNDGLNTIIPYGDDAYHKARPTIGIAKDVLYAIDDYVGMPYALSDLSVLLEAEQLAVVQGVGYPNPNRSHFESMDIWHAADPRGRRKDGWLARATAELKTQPGKIPAFHIGQQQLPLALRGGTAAALHPDKPFGFEFEQQVAYERYERNDASDAPVEAPAPEHATPPHEQLMRELAELSSAGGAGSAADFTRRVSLDTYGTVNRLRELTSADFQRPEPEFTVRGRKVEYKQHGLSYELRLVARMIESEFGARIYYVSQDGYDTHGDQRSTHQELLATLANAVYTFIEQLKTTGHADRVVLLTFSEFGRRLQENGSRGTDHGAASCLFVAGTQVQGGLKGKYPSLTDLDDGDLKHTVDFRQVYATLLDQWLHVDSSAILGGKFDHLPLIKKG